VDRTASERTIRPADANDAPAVAALWVRSRMASIPAIPAPVHDAEDVLSWFAADVIPRGDTWVMEQGGQLVALLVLEGSWIDQLYVDPDRTGIGCGSALLQHAKQLHSGKLDLWTFRSNSRARTFYERHGFVAVGTTDGENEENAPDIHFQWSGSREGSRTDVGPISG
jgi:GNAT superfamily N-acetyltransferase